ncbi:ATPase [Candidatus Electrothrix sp.]|uniref:ATPase n=1 Tax=Candidatus Electrothrix sp. TaxID=2170559 RepID=UPI0040574BD5
MLLADFGTSYTKLFTTDQENSNPRVVPTRELAPTFKADLATGHNAKRRGKESINELIALAKGGNCLIPESNAVLLDCGSRDIKCIRYQKGEVADMGWNAECGASMGFTIELLESYYKIDYSQVAVPATGFSVTCGVLGMSHIFDAVVTGSSETEAVAKFVWGIARNAFRFAGSPNRLYLSGGLCDNPLFLGCIPCEVVPLGRFVLLEGLRAHLDSRK